MKLLIEQLRYNHWAVSNFINTILQLEPDDLEKNLKSSFTSIHETLAHMLWVEELWFERWQGNLFDKTFNPAYYPTIKFIEHRFFEIFSKQILFFDELIEDGENKKISYVNFGGETWEYSLLQMVEHLMFHSAYHRGQLATMLRQLGKVPPKTDYLIFVDERSSGKV